MSVRHDAGAAEAPAAASSSTADPIVVGIVEDHPVVAAGTARVLAATEGIRVAWTAGDLTEARARLALGDIDVAVVDIRLGTESGLELIAEAGRAGSAADGPAHGSGPAQAGRIASAPARPAFVILTGYDYPQYRAAAARLGAASLVVKMAPIDDLVAAIRRAATGSRDAGEPGERSPTARDLRVLQLVADGRSNAEIAGMLGLAEKTVEGRLGRLFARFGVASRTELATRAIRDGWLDLPAAG